MKMFASDLDRTLIYSERALEDFKQTGIGKLIGVEFKADREVAFMTKRSIEALKLITENMLFVPVTTRTLDQYHRVTHISKEIPLTYAITSNGANIIYKGGPLVDWSHLVVNRLKHECAAMEEMVEKIESLELNGEIKKAENLFFYYILQESLTSKTVDIVKKMAIESGWRTSIQGKKLYFMPNPICKGEAVKFIKEREGISSVYGAGDSLLDHDFLKECDISFVPSHGELANEKNGDFSYIFTKYRGIMAGEEILLEIAKNTVNLSFN